MDNDNSTKWFLLGIIFMYSIFNELPYLIVAIFIYALWDLCGLKRIYQLNKMSGRQLIKDKSYLKDRLENLLENSQRLRTFEQFDCSEFFRGVTLARRNKIRYEKEWLLNNKRIEFVEKCLKNLK